MIATDDDDNDGLNDGERANDEGELHGNKPAHEGRLRNMGLTPAVLELTHTISNRQSPFILEIRSDWEGENRESVVSTSDQRA